MKRLHAIFRGCATGVLFLCLVPCGCADTEFGVQDAALPDKGVPDLPPVKWDTGPLPDGLPLPPQSLMFAHSMTELYVIHPTTLKLDVLGTFSFASSIPTDEQSVNDIAVDPDGRLFGITKTFIYEIDPKTVKASKVTAVTAASKPPPMVALTFEKSGILLGSDKAGALYRIYYKEKEGKTPGTVEKLGDYGNSIGSSGDLVAIKDGTIYGVSDTGAGATSTNNHMIKIAMPGGSVPSTKLASPGCALGHAKVWGLAFWAGTIYGFTRGDSNDGKMISIAPDEGDVTKTCTVKVIKTFPYEFWGAAVSPLAPIK